MLIYLIYFIDKENTFGKMDDKGNAYCDMMNHEMDCVNNILWTNNPDPFHSRNTVSHSKTFIHCINFVDYNICI